MKFIFTFFSFIVLTLESFCSSTIIGENTFLNAIKTNETIVIDGKLNEKVWQRLPTAVDFRQKDPQEGEKATEQTAVWVAYDENALYIAAYMYDSHPDSIVGKLSRRDQDNESDWFSVYLDSYNDKRTGYFFYVNAVGSIMDGTLYNDSWNDNSWNGVWESKTSITNKGWCVEIRIPFSQIRFTENPNMKWGINFKRNISRKKEADYFIMVPKKESGFVSHFATLQGLDGIKSHQRIEILPYFVQKAQYLKHDGDDPYYKSKQYRETFGADFKLGIGSNLTLDGTINPDFGQVEVDPAVVNLSAFETYYDEKRPFFIEGNNIFSFGYGGSNNNWGFNWGNTELFYSRRIGRYPQGEVNSDGPVNFPTETRILGATKLTGKVDGNVSVGFIDAVTERTYAKIYDTNNEQEVEPLTNYSVLRAQKEFDKGRYGLGFIGTSVFRSLQDSSLKTLVGGHSYVYGLDGWVTLDKDGLYVVNGYFSGSSSVGTSDYITKLQRSPLRYMQRPDAGYAKIDSSATSLNGFSGRITINKQKGNFYLNSALGVISPGFEANDLGYQWRADVINGHIVTGYQWFDPDVLFRDKSLYVAAFKSMNFDGNTISNGFYTFFQADFINYYFVNIQAGYSPRYYTGTYTRGGPLMKGPTNFTGSFYLQSDSRNPLILGFSTNATHEKSGSFYDYFSLSIQWIPKSNLNISFEPFIERNFDHVQYIDQITDQYATATYGSRYLFGDLDQKTVGGNIRLNWTFTPTISLQLFIQPLFSVGKYSQIKELAKPSTDNMNVYGKSGNSSIVLDNNENQYLIDPDGNGPSQQFAIDNPDFNFKSLRGNLIFRWEFLPGSTFYLVWTHERTNDYHPGDFLFKRDITDLAKSVPDNVYVAKINYWLNF